MHYLTCGISSLLHSVNLILFTLPPGSHSDYFVLMRLLNTLTHSLTSSCTYHLITVTTFALTIHHSIGVSLQT